MSNSLTLAIHLFAAALWIGVLGVEFILEQSRTRSRDHGFNVASIHYHIDVWLETPAFCVVLITGAMLLDGSRLSGLYLLKVAMGLTAISGNVMCVYAIVRRKWSADQQDFSGLVRYSRMVDQLSAIAVPAGFIALFCGFYLVHGASR